MTVVVVKSCFSLQPTLIYFRGQHSELLLIHCHDEYQTHGPFERICRHSAHLDPFVTIRKYSGRGQQLRDGNDNIHPGRAHACDNFMILKRTIAIVYTDPLFRLSLLSLTDPSLLSHRYIGG